MAYRLISELHWDRDYFCPFMFLLETW
jgi:hypothetical protein